MMFSLPNIVIVDNDEGELEAIKTAFFNGGMPCLPIQYKNEPGNQSGIDHVELSNGFNARVLVLDLNLTDMQNASPQNLIGPLVKVIQKLPVSGPYLLCIWSKYGQEVDEVMRLIQERYKNKITLPLQYSVIAKTELVSDPTGLKQKVKGLISENQIFDSLLVWESRVSEASRMTSNAIFNLANDTKREDSISGCAAQLQKVLAIIGNEALGSKHAKERPALAMDAGLAPVLEDQLSAMLEDELNEKWSAALPDIGSKHIELDDTVKASLNSFFHIEEVGDGYPKDHRGVFVSLDLNYINRNEEKFTNRMGRSLENLIHEEFLGRKGKVDGKAFTARAREGSQLGFLEISAACDHAQRKTKLPRYILGVMIPVEFDELTHFKTSNGKWKDIAHEGIYRFPIVNFRGNLFIAKFSFKYQFGTQPDDNKWFGTPLFRVREQILSEITFNNSQYFSRPGIISFR